MKKLITIATIGLLSLGLSVSADSKTNDKITEVRNELSAHQENGATFQADQSKQELEKLRQDQARESEKDEQLLFTSIFLGLIIFGVGGIGLNIWSDHLDKKRRNN